VYLAGVIPGLLQGQRQVCKETIPASSKLLAVSPFPAEIRGEIKTHFATFILYPVLSLASRFWSCNCRAHSLTRASKPKVEALCNDSEAFAGFTQKKHCSVSSEFWALKTITSEKFFHGEYNSIGEQVHVAAYVGVGCCLSGVKTD